MDQDWVDKSLHPVLHLDGEEIELVCEPLSVGDDERVSAYGPTFVQFRIECIIRHSIGGRLVYTANDLHFDSRAFNNFAHCLKAILEGNPVQTALSSVGSELVFTVLRDSSIRINVLIQEREPGDDTDTVATAGRNVRNPDVLYRWVDELRSFSQYLDNWILMKIGRFR